MVPHQNQVIAFQNMLRETPGLTNGYNGNNMNMKIDMETIS